MLTVAMGSIDGTTDSGIIRRLFTNTTGLDVVIKEVYLYGVCTAVTNGYETLTVADQDSNTIVAGSVSSVLVGTSYVDLGTPSATHGVIPDGEYVKVTVSQSASGATITDCNLQIKYALQSPED